MAIPILPPELIEHCISFLDSRDRATCIAVCKASKVCNHAATPLLYQLISITTEGPGVLTTSQRLQLLCRTLVGNLVLARYPNTLAYRLFWREMSQKTRALLEEGSFWHPLRKHAGVDADLCDHLQTAITGLEHGDSQEDEPWLILLFGLCRNLRNLNLTGEPGFVRDMPILESVLRFEESRSRDAPIQHPRLLCAETVSLDNSASISADADIDVHALAGLLLLPRLRSVSLGSFWRSPGSFDISGPISTLEILHIERCHRQLDDLELILPRCRNLRDLSIEYLYRRDIHSSLRWPDLGEALRTCCPRLESLRLDNWPEWTSDISTDTIEAIQNTSEGAMFRPRGGRGLGDLRSLMALRTLAISESALFGTIHEDDYAVGEDRPSRPDVADLLPTSLKHLTIVCEDEDIRSRRSLLQHSFIESLEDCVVLNSKKTYWYSKKEGEGELDRIATELRRRTEQEEAMPEWDAKLIDKLDQILESPSGDRIDPC